MNIKICCSASEMAGIKVLAEKVAGVDILKLGYSSDKSTYIQEVNEIENGKYFEIKTQLNSKFLVDYLDLLIKHSTLIKKATKAYIDVLLKSAELKEDFVKFTIDFCKKYVM